MHTKFMLLTGIFSQIKWNYNKRAYGRFLWYYIRNTTGNVHENNSNKNRLGDTPSRLVVDNTKNVP